MESRSTYHQIDINGWSAFRKADCQKGEMPFIEMIHSEEFQRKDSVG